MIKDTKELNLYKVLDIDESIEKPFIKLYLEDISKLWNISKPGQIIFGEMLKMVTYNPTDKIHNSVELSMRTKKLIKSKLSSEENTSNTLFSRGIKNLLKSELITKLDCDLYYISHSICSKTNWANTEAMKSIKVETIYQAGYRSLTTFVEMNRELTKEIILNNR
ncbi:MAG: hypothetical protein ACRC5G_03325 [Cetobacterium sp.]